MTEYPSVSEDVLGQTVWFWENDIDSLCKITTSKYKIYTNMVASDATFQELGNLITPRSQKRSGNITKTWQRRTRWRCFGVWLTSSIRYSSLMNPVYLRLKNCPVSNVSCMPTYIPTFFKDHSRNTVADLGIVWVKSQFAIIASNEREFFSPPHCGHLPKVEETLTNINILSEN